MIVLGSLGGEWLGLLCSQSYWKLLSLAPSMWVTGLALFLKLAKNGCPWLPSLWVTGLVLFSRLLKMLILDSLGGEWLSILYFQGCWLFLALSWWVTGLSLFEGCWNWLFLAFQSVSEWACFIFKAAEMVVLGSSGCRWLGFVFEAAENSCPCLSRMWVTGLASCVKAENGCSWLFS